MNLWHEFGQFAITVGLGSILLAVLDKYFSRHERKANVKKIGADVERALSEGSLAWANDLRADNADLRARLAKEEDITELQERQLRACRAAFDEHARWDRAMVRKLRAAGIEDIEDPPRLRFPENVE